PTHLAEIAFAVICCCSALTPVARAAALRRSALTVRAETLIRPLSVGGSRLLLTGVPLDSTAGRGLIASGPWAARPKAEPGIRCLSARAGFLSARADSLSARVSLSACADSLSACAGSLSACAGAATPASATAVPTTSAAAPARCLLRAILSPWRLATGCALGDGLARDDDDGAERYPRQDAHRAVRNPHASVADGLAENRRVRPAVERDGSRAAAEGVQRRRVGPRRQDRGAVGVLARREK